MLPMTNHLTRLALAGLTVAVSSALAYSAARSAASTATAIPAAANRIAPASVAVRRATTTASAGPIASAALAVADAGADPYFVEPRVPKAAGTPCVETLATNVPFVESLSSFQFTWTPTGACHGPWAKIVLVVETTGGRDISAAAMRIHFNTLEPGGSSTNPAPGGGVLFMGAPQQTNLVGTWRFERDVTEYADALNRGMQVGYGTAYRDNGYNDFDDLGVTARSVKLLYYPASTATPAQRAADVMRSLDTSEFTANASWTFDALPRNIERAYLDVMARTFDPGRAWYSCVPTTAVTTWPQLNSRFGMGDFRPFIAGLPMGCSADNGSYRELEVYIDNQRAGLAPMFPSLPSTMFLSDVVDYPAPSVQALNILPFRVDLTPFAALLDNGLPHTIDVRAVNSAAGAVVTGQLLLYLDKGRSIVTGGLTRNTLAAQSGVATVTSTLVLTGDTLEGDLTTYRRREYNIEGYVDTSHGRIRSTVYQVSRFSNAQHLRVVGPDQTTLPRGENYLQDYTQRVRLSNTVDRVSRRIRGTTLLSEDKDYTTWPVSIDYSNGGEVRWSDEGLAVPTSSHYEIDVHQARGQRGTHYRLGSSGRYDSALADVFDGSHSWRNTGVFNEGHYDWSSTRRYLFTDNRGSCYSAGLTTTSGVLQTRTRGTECPNGVNGIRWYAHPDGAPEALLWTVNP